jgi:hypothetical protein
MHGVEHLQHQHDQRTGIPKDDSEQNGEAAEHKGNRQAGQQEEGEPCEHDDEDFGRGHQLATP